MRIIYNIMFGLACLLCATSASAAQMTVNSGSALTAGKQTELTIMLRDGKGAPLTLDKLKEVHTQKIHLLLIDPSLSDYHHLHPVAGKNPGEYKVSFTPNKAGYIVYADITPLSGAQEYIRQQLGNVKPAAIDKTPSQKAKIAGHDFVLALDEPLYAGDEAMMHVAVTIGGKSFMKLEPVMGAYAHMVCFGEDLHSIIHTHPMSDEPKKITDRGGPELDFHIEPEKAGFIKCFTQVKIDEKDVFVPFGLTVQQ